MLVLEIADDAHSAKEICTEVVIFLCTELWQQSLSLISNCRNMSHLVGGKLFWPYQIIFKHAVSFVVTKTLTASNLQGSCYRGGGTGGGRDGTGICGNSSALQQNSKCRGNRNLCSRFHCDIAHCEIVQVWLTSQNERKQLFSPNHVMANSKST